MLGWTCCWVNQLSDNQFSDEIDRANFIADMANQEAVNHYRLLAAPEQTRDTSGNWETEECVDCGEDIGAARLNLGKIRCISCQTIKEKKERNYAKY